MSDMLTEDEKRAISMCGELHGLICKIVGQDITRDADLREMIGPVHILQRSIMAQAAARAYPTTYRLLGEVVRD